MAPEFDVVVWGATGFTGALVAEYLNTTYGTGGDLRWAIAGRNLVKLENLRSRLGVQAKALPILVADSHDRSSLDALTARTDVVLTTVGPYAKYGSELVASCVAQRTHYCDLAGETQWIRRMVDTHHDDAQSSGTRIVHCCGFDSVPSDLGVWFTQRSAQQRYGRPCRSIAMMVKAARGGFSGGTAASLVNVLQEVKQDRSLRRVLADPYSLNPPQDRSGPDERDQQDVRYDAVAESWTAPFVMAAINTRVVRRSHALLGYPWGREFRYREAIMTGAGPAGAIKAGVVAAGLAAIVAGASFDLSRSFMERFVLPEPGEGPDEATRECGYFNLRFFGELDDGTVFRTKVTGDRDPGYGSTAKMLAESAVCLAKDALDSPGGVLTPAGAMAGPLLQRLQERAGLTFSVID